MKINFSRRKYALKAYQLLKIENLPLHELGTQYASQALRSSVAVYTYAMKDGRIQKLFFHVFYERHFPVTKLDGATFLQMVFDSSHSKAQISYEMRMPTALGAQPYFHGIVSACKEAGSKS